MKVVAEHGVGAILNLLMSPVTSETIPELRLGKKFKQDSCQKARKAEMAMFNGCLPKNRLEICGGFKFRMGPTEIKNFGEVLEIFFPRCHTYFLGTQSHDYSGTKNLAGAGTGFLSLR